MARSFASASSQYLQFGSAMATADPLSVSVWAYPLQTNAACTLFSISRHTATNERYHVYLNNSAKAGIGKQNSTTSQFTSTVNSYSANQWCHVAATFRGNADREIYLNGDVANSGVGTTTVTAGTNLSRTAIGGLMFGSSVQDLMNGYIAHVAVWNGALTDATVERLYNGGIGLDPRGVLPGFLLAYWPFLDNDGDRDWWGQFNLTASGSPTYAQHPPVLMRSRPRFVIGSGVTAPVIDTISIAGTRQVGNTLTCNATSSPGGATFTYQWYVADDISGTNQTAISGATSQTYELSYANVGAVQKLYEGLDANGEAFIACGATPTLSAIEGDETISDYISITEAAAVASIGSPFESRYIR